ncbi:G-box-binding factor 1-like [Ziziphus jujuba]|uniref:G-box-binding factor 1-like n=1 Tax=Ziziphus jujuba TaxID=326968 RepID=A0ABM4A5B0_ZIZJJ|nr:G-box-binding factor 1-like [Ziziphus jujuba]XP_060671918.1 G-box-binding factor 1-like [Ziziphus jujuba]
MVQTKSNTGIASNWSSTKSILAKEEHDQRKERRKQSNRESAKRSRCRRQEECRKLQAKAEDLAKETSNLRAGIMRVSKECRKLKKENKSIIKGLEKMYGPDAVGDLKAEEPGSVTGDGESSSDESGNETLHGPYLWAIFCMYI